LCACAIRLFAGNNHLSTRSPLGAPRGLGLRLSSAALTRPTRRQPADKFADNSSPAVHAGDILRYAPFSTQPAVHQPSTLNPQPFLALNFSQKPYITSPGLQNSIFSSITHEITRFNPRQPALTRVNPHKEINFFRAQSFVRHETLAFGCIFLGRLFPLSLILNPHSFLSFLFPTLAVYSRNGF
jgi:hypothetical protein